MNKREEIIAKAMSIPKLAPSAQRIVEILSDPDTDAATVARIIELDPGLTANILRLANSALLGCSSPAATVKEAVVRLGLTQICQLAIAASVAPRVKPAIKGYDLKPGELLEQSICVGLAAMELGRLLKLDMPPYVFTAGLLINIGKTVLGEYMEIDAAPILKKAYEELIPFEKAEEAILGVSHTELGALLLTHWRIPAPIVNVVRYRLVPEESPERDIALDLVHVGDIITKMTGIGMGVDGMHYTPSVEVFDRLGLEPGMMEAIMETVVVNIGDLKKAFLGEA